MNKKFLLMLLTGTMLSVGAAFATDMPEADNGTKTEVSEMQMKKFGEDYHKEMAAKMAKDLGLTEEQKTKAEQIRKAGREKIAPLMDKMKDLRQQIDEERRANMQEFEKILTPEQQDRFNMMKQRHFDKEGPRKPGDHRMMRGLHKVGPNGEMLPPPDGEKAGCPYRHGKKCPFMNGDMPRPHKDFAPRPHHKGHKAKGGFIEDTPQSADKGGFVED